jgi:hypothetical protein
MSLDQSKFNRKRIDPTASGKGQAGILPTIPNADEALVTLDEAIWGQMLNEYNTGREKGQTTHNKYLDPYFTWMPGYTNVITGWPGHGKSQLFFELLLMRAVFTNKKSAIWPSENLPPKRFYQGLVHTLTGRPTDKSQKNALSPEEYKRAAEYVRDRIILLDPKAGMPFTPAHMLAYFEAAIVKHGGPGSKDGIAHCMVDPWNKADHSAMTKMGGIEPYLIHALGLCTKWSMASGQCLVLTAHPRRASEEMGYSKSRPVPTGGMISGGQTWENMAHYVGAMHRPFDYIENNTQAAFFSLKCKDERDVAKRGEIGYKADGIPPMVPINWDPITNRYRWGHERWSPLDAEKVASLYAAPQAAPAAPAPQLFAAAQQPAPRPLPASTFETDGTAPDEYSGMQFGPRPINSDSLPSRP